jgi:predicted ATPase
LPAVRKAVITGAPGAGKSTVLAELGRRGFSVIPEVARSILKRSGGMELRRDDPTGFAEAMLDAQLMAWDCGDNSGPIVFDRGFADIVGFLWVEGLPVSNRIDWTCRELRFDGPVFRASPWEAIYSTDEERIQGWDEAIASDEAVSRAWRCYGYDIVDLPLVSPSDRASFIVDRL